jgi:hypothetical protein
MMIGIGIPIIHNRIERMVFSRNEWQSAPARRHGRSDAVAQLAAGGSGDAGDKGAEHQRDGHPQSGAGSGLARRVGRILGFRLSSVCRLAHLVRSRPAM